MDPRWARHLWSSQKLTEYTINGRSYPRIRYGKEGWKSSYYERPCHDCGARKGLFHGPGCDMERCPACRGQMISCSCDWERPPGP